MKFVPGRSVSTALSALALVSSLAGCALAAPSVVISQAYGGGGNAGATYRQDFVELFNRGSAAVDLSGWSVQYASAAGTSWQVTPLSGSIAPGQYVLVQEAAGSGGTTNLPAPDVLGTIAMGGTAGKVALVNATAALSGPGCPFDASVVDFVGYGAGATCFEGSGAAPAPSNTTAVLRASAGCIDTQVNASDFAAGGPVPRNRASALNACDGGPTPPAGLGTATPSLVGVDGTTRLTVAVSPGQNPASTGITVSADATAIGGSAETMLFDDGTHGDAAAGDLVFTLDTAVGSSPGLKTLPVTIRDAEGRSASTTIALTVQAPAMIVVSQVYGGGGNAGATLRHDFIELFNRGSAPVDISGWSLQYASAGGAFSASAKTDLSGVILPGRYFLVQQAAGTGGTEDLVPDAVGTIAMASTSGKVALVRDGVPLAGSGCPIGPTVVDLVGYGAGTSCVEGPGAAPAPGNTIAIRRAGGGCTDTNSNVADFAALPPSPRNSSAPANECGAPPTPPIPIHEIQGVGPTSAFAGQVVGTRGIVTAVRFNNGFFLQTPDAEADTDAETSEGLFVFTGGPPPEAARVGNLVEVRGTVEEFVPPSTPNRPPTTEISGVPTVTLLSSGHPLPAPIVLTASDLDPAASSQVLERREGMRVRVDSLTVVAPTQGNVNETNATGSSNGVFFGVVTGTPRPLREPGIPIGDPLPPGAPCCLPRFDENRERLRIDSDGQIGSPRLEVTAGAVLTGLVGPFEQSFGTNTILPDPPPGGPVVAGNIQAVPVRAATEDEVTIASANLQRFFDAEANSNAPVLTPLAYANRLQKASLLIRNILRSPDVIGVQEVESLPVLQTLAARVNADAVTAGGADPRYEAFLVEGNDVGGIDSGFLVKTSRIRVLDVVQEGKDTIFELDGSLLNDRPPLVLRADAAGPDGRRQAFTVIVNHLRSLSDVDDPLDGDRVRRKRRAQAEYLARLIQARQTAQPDERIVSVGDYNAFPFNDGYVDSIGTILGRPTAADQVLLPSPDLVDPDLVNLVDTVPPAQRYSYTFDGHAQELDHILVTANLSPQVRGLQYARTNADFPETYRSDASRPERVSDHDPLVAYFSLPGNHVPTAAAGADRRLTVDGQCRATVALDGSASSDPDGDPLQYTWTGPFGSASGAAPTVTLGPGVHVATLTVDDGRGGVATDSVTLTVVDATPPAITVHGRDRLVVELGRRFVDPGARALDNCDGAVPVTTAGAVNTRVAGTYTLTYAARDAADNWAAATRTVKVVDTRRPRIHRVRATPNILWPSNDRMVGVEVDVTASDASGDPTCRIVAVASDEPVTGRRFGRTTPDWRITGDLSLELRAEHHGHDGRTYTIRVVCTDASGLTARASTCVRVPHRRPRR